MRELRWLAVVGDLRLERRLCRGGCGGLLLAAALLRRLLRAVLFLLLLRRLRLRDGCGLRLRRRSRVGLGHRAGTDEEARPGDDKQLAKIHSVVPSEFGRPYYRSEDRQSKHIAPAVL